MQSLNAGYQHTICIGDANIELIHRRRRIVEPGDRLRRQILAAARVDLQGIELPDQQFGPSLKSFEVVALSSADLSLHSILVKSGRYVLSKVFVRSR